LEYCFSGAIILNIHLNPSLIDMGKRRSPRKHNVHPRDPRYNVNQYQRGTIYFPPKYQKYSEIVSLKDPIQARSSAQGLELEYDTAQKRDKKLRVIRVTSLAKNRAKVMSKNKRLSLMERKKARHIEAIYGISLRYMKDSYLNEYHKPPKKLKKEGENVIKHKKRNWIWSYRDKNWYLMDLHTPRYEDTGIVF
jgi:hypothetical protein